MVSETIVKNSQGVRIKKPSWLRVKSPLSKEFAETKSLMSQYNFATVCEEAACPNIGECWSKKHATFMILGDICTRACAFCNIKTGVPRIVDDKEPEQVAEATAKLGLKHVVITSVDRDDLEDGGANQFVKSIKKIREYSPNTTIEILTPDFRRKEGALELVVDSVPDVFNHNVETVAGLYHSVRPGARYFHSLSLLKQVKELNPYIFTKSGFMLGLGEKREEILQLLDDLRVANIDFITIGQYLQPTPKHAVVQRFVPPSEFDFYKKAAIAKGFLLVASSPLTRSSYHADSDFEKLKKARKAQLRT